MVKPSDGSSLTALIAGALAWLVPGAGHVYMGRKVRGLILCVCINALFWSGMAIGGVMTVDPIGQSGWYAAQMLTGISGVTGWQPQKRYRQGVARHFPAHLRVADPKKLPADPESRKEWYGRFVHRMAQDGTALVYPADVAARAYTGVAGMLNAMCIFDAVMLALLGRVGEPPPKREEETEEVAPPRAGDGKGAEA
jgi:hypothetical protein